MIIILPLLKVPVETESENACCCLGEVGGGSGTVAANVHWIVLPSTLPLTEFTFSCRANTVE